MMAGTTKRKFERSRTRAEGVEWFEMGSYLSRNVFECKTAGRKELGGQKLPPPGQTSKWDFGLSEMRADGLGVFEKG